MKAILTTVSAILFLFATAPFASADPMNGEELFKKKCSACHNITEKLKVGPGLAGISKRHSDAWLEKWISNPQAVWEENDPETAEMKSRVKDGTKRDKTKMKIKMNSKDIPDLIEYLKTL